MSRIRAVVFDMDGVLVDSEPYWQRVWQEQVFAAVTDGAPSMEEVTGRNYRESLRDLADTYGLPGDIEHFAHQFETAAERIYNEKVSLTTSISALFQAVRNRGRALGVVSSAPQAWIETVVDRFALGPLDCVLSAAALDGPGKPAPEIYKQAATTLSVAPAECIVVEDSEHGIRAAAQAGATVIRFQRGQETEAGAGADVLATDPDQLRETVLELLD